MNERDMIHMTGPNGRQVYVGLVCRRGGGRSGRPVEFCVLPSLEMRIETRWFRTRSEAVNRARIEAARLMREAA